MKTRVLALLAVPIVAGLALWTLKEAPIVTIDMPYTEFRARALADLDPVTDDLITFSPSTTAFFQQIRQAPSAWLPLMHALLDDPGIPDRVILGASAALLDLPVDDLARYVGELLDRVEARPGLMNIALTVAFNGYRGSSFLEPGSIAQTDLYDHAGRPAVRAVLERMWAHPMLPEHERGPGWPLHDIFAGQ